jgi:hypothetical protein
MEIGFMDEPFPVIVIRDDEGEIMLSPPEVLALMDFLSERVEKLEKMKEAWENAEEMSDEEAIEKVVNRMWSQMGKPNRQQRRKEKRSNKR